MSPSTATGPRTAPGKARSSQNSRTHGLTAKILRISEDDQPAFDSLQSALRAQLAPEGELECALTDRIIRAHWDLRRLDSLEADLFAAFDPLNEKHSLTLSRFSLYRSRIENGLYKAQHELRALQEERLLRTAALKDEGKTFTPIIRIATVQKSFVTFNTVVKKRTPNPALI